MQLLLIIKSVQKNTQHSEQDRMKFFLWLSLYALALPFTAAAAGPFLCGGNDHGIARRLPPGGKVKICRIPRGDTRNWHTITVSENAVAAHLDQGDLWGACDSHCQALCDDGNLCTIHKCNETGCIQSTLPVDCNVQNKCTRATCDSSVGCLYTNVTCDEGNECTENTCDPNKGCVYIPLDRLCTPPDKCHNSTCSIAEGCVNAPVSCDDGNKCTTDTCDPDTGCVNAPVSCDDGNECTIDSCDTSTGDCVYTPKCSDKSFTAFATNWELKQAIGQREEQATKDKYGPTVNCWNVSQVTDMSYLFYVNFRFDEAIDCWNVSSVTNMYSMFSNSQFDHPLESWDVSSVTNMQSMFEGSRFNQSLASWNVSSVTNMRFVFSHSQFNQPLESWDVKSVTNMQGMFVFSQFNQWLASWNVSSVTDMERMFSYSKFNQLLDYWDVSSVTDMRHMFEGSSQFNQDLCSWGPKLSRTVDVSNMFGGMWGGSSCVNQTDPNVEYSPVTPLCFNCKSSK